MASFVPSRRIVGGAFVVLLVVLAWQLGERRGRERAEIALTSARAELADVRPDDAPPEPLSGTSPDGLPDGGVAPSGSTSEAGGAAIDADAMAALEGERTMLLETVRSLRAELERADRLSADERAELELYRRVGTDGTAAGLAIDTLERRDADPAGGEPAVLRVTLVQVRGRDRVQGRVDVVPLGAEAAVLGPESSGEIRAALATAEETLWSAPFDLRFFETLEIPLDERFPEVVEVRVVPDGKRHPPFRSRFRDQAIRIVD